MINPFDLQGPQFLLFYIVFATIVLVGLYFFVCEKFGGDAEPLAADARLLLRDPYLVAYMRGGSREMTKIALFSLLERKLATTVGSSINITHNAAEKISNLFEKQVLSACRLNPTTRQVLYNGGLQVFASTYARELRQHNLIANEAEMARRQPAFRVALCLLLGVTALKLWIAFIRGHRNVAFLIILAVLAAIVCVAICYRRRTRQGDIALQNQRILFGSLQWRVKRLATSGATNEALIVAATFGLQILPSDQYPAIRELRRAIYNSRDSTSGCGSGCGSSGCGGGGGCGGCGS